MTCSFQKFGKVLIGSSDNLFVASLTYFCYLDCCKKSYFKVALMILAGLSYLFNSWFSLACITSFPFIALFSYWCNVMLPHISQPATFSYRSKFSTWQKFKSWYFFQLCFFLNQDNFVLILSPPTQEIPHWIPLLFMNLSKFQFLARQHCYLSSIVISSFWSQVFL